MNTQAELEETRKRLKEASEKKQREHFIKIYEEAVRESALREHETLLDQQGHLLPESEPAPPPPQTAVLHDSGIDFMFPTTPLKYTGQLKSKKKISKKNNSKKKRSKKKRSKKKRSKKRRSRKY